MSKFMLIKKKIRPRPHDLQHKFNLSLSISGRFATNYPIISHTEALGDPASYHSHPQHASFAEASSSSVYPDSKVHSVRTIFRFSMTKGARETDKIKNLRVLIIPIAIAFKESYEATDDATSTEVQDIMFMQKESTNRRGYPLWNGTKLGGNSPTLGSDEIGLTTNTGIEGVNFNFNTYFDALQYLTIANKIKSVTGKPKWITVGHETPATYAVKFDNAAKAANPYTYFGCLIILPPAAHYSQYGESADASSIDHITVGTTTRYNEWSENFDSSKT